MSNAEKLREQMRREMLSSLNDSDETVDSARSRQTDQEGPEKQVEKVDYSGVDWGAEVSSTKRVLAMQVSPASRCVWYLTFSLKNTSSILYRNCGTSIFSAFGALTSMARTRRWKGQEDVLGKTKTITRACREVSCMSSEVDIVPREVKTAQ